MKKQMSTLPHILGEIYEINSLSTLFGFIHLFINKAFWYSINLFNEPFNCCLDVVFSCGHGWKFTHSLSGWTWTKRSSDKVKWRLFYFNSQGENYYWNNSILLLLVYFKSWTLSEKGSRSTLVKSSKKSAAHWPLLLFNPILHVRVKQ